MKNILTITFDPPVEIDEDKMCGSFDVNLETFGQPL